MIPLYWIFSIQNLSYFPSQGAVLRADKPHEQSYPVSLFWVCTLGMPLAVITVTPGVPTGDTCHNQRVNWREFNDVLLNYQGTGKCWKLLPPSGPEVSAEKAVSGMREKLQQRENSHVAGDKRTLLMPTPESGTERTAIKMSWLLLSPIAHVPVSLTGWI